jgi:hypothetical protein
MWADQPRVFARVLRWAHLQFYRHNAYWLARSATLHVRFVRHFGARPQPGDLGAYHHGIRGYLWWRLCATSGPVLRAPSPSIWTGSEGRGAQLSQEHTAPRRSDLGAAENPRRASASTAMS